MEASDIQVAYLIPDGFWSSTVTSAAEVFYGMYLNRHAIPSAHSRQFSLSFLRTTPQRVRGFSGFALETAYFASTEQARRQFDAIIIPSVWNLSLDNLQESQPALEWLTKQHQGGAIVAGLVTGVFYLAAAGLLDGREATIHWASENIFRQRYPSTRLSPQVQLIESDRVVTTSNTFATFDVALLLIQRFIGDRAAEYASQYFTIRHQDAPLPEFLEPTTHDKLVDAARDLMRLQYAEAPSLETIAKQLNVTSRTLSRRFTQATGISPIQYLSRHRLHVARRLLQSTHLQIQIIAEQTGYGSSTVFCRQFKQAYRLSPNDFRKAQARGEFT